MAWGKAFTDAEIAYVEKHFPKKSCATIAAKLGRSTRGVQLLVKRLGLREPQAGAPARNHGDAPAPARYAEAAAEEGPQDELAELRSIKRVLKRTLRDDIDPRDVPKISAELREVIKRISEIEEGGGDGSGGTLAGGAGNITIAVPLRPA